MHVIAAKAVAFKEALAPEFKAYQQQVVEERRSRGRDADRARPAHRQRPHREPRDAGRPARQGHHRQGSRGRAGRRPHDLNKNAHPERSAKSRWSPAASASARRRMTTRGFKDEEARATANLIADVLDNPRDAANIAAVRAKVHALTARLPGLPLKPARPRPHEAARSAATTTRRSSRPATPTTATSSAGAAAASSCDKRFTTYERAEIVTFPSVVKKDGTPRRVRPGQGARLDDAGAAQAPGQHRADRRRASSASRRSCSTSGAARSRLDQASANS